MKILLSLLGVSYLISPYDIFPDIFVGIGWIDDLILLGVIWWYLYVYRKRRYGYAGAGSQRAGYSGASGQDRTTDKEPPPSRDPFTVLGVEEGASSSEIKAAYRRLASQYHPDKVLHLGEEFRALAEIRFKEIQAAYQEVTRRPPT